MGRGSETTLQVRNNLNYLIKRFKRWYAYLLKTSIVIHEHDEIDFTKLEHIAHYTMKTGQV